MRIAEVIGTVTISRAHESLAGGTFRLAVPLGSEQLAGATADGAEPLVVYDELGAGIGSRIALSEGGEAAQPFLPDIKPVDAYNAAILDAVHLATDR